MPKRAEKCAVCGCVEKRVTGPEAPGFRATAGDVAFEQPPYHIYECTQCGLLYRDVILSADEFSQYYAAAKYEGWETAGYYPTETAVLSVLRALPPRSRILDFGCSSGRLLAGLLPEYDCHGFEINDEAAAVAAMKGLRMFSLAEIEAGEAGKFAAIVLVDVFEHLSDPVETLRTLTRLLAPDGVLLLVTGNGDAPACRRDPAQFWYFRIIEHVCMLTRRSAEFIAAESGLKLASWQTLSHYKLTLRERLVQRTQDFAYWQFRGRTLLARTVLPFIPLLRRARLAAVAPAYTCSPDHVLAIFRSSLGECGDERAPTRINE
ncbi:MAG: class I SAM-dependent methyltransferase [Chthoniobacterales bacterium]|nr:class I SAM-dependent methyltransferase [Chthoniobacterales bacterium]